MKSRTVPSEIARKNPNFERIAERIIKSPDLLPDVFDGLSADVAKIKYGCLKLLRIISERDPALLYPKINLFFRLLNSSNTILKWGAILILGNLATADSKRKIDRELSRYLEPISGRVMITAANVIRGAGKIACAKPHLADEIARVLVRVERAKYETDECRNVALGHAVQAIDQFFEHLNNPRPAIEFIRRQLSNSRSSVRVKAAKFLKKHD